MKKQSFFLRLACLLCMSSLMSNSAWAIAQGGLLGDVNWDKELSIADVTELIDYLLNPSLEPAGLPDVDLDGKVSIADATTLIDMILMPSDKFTFVAQGVVFNMMPVEGGTFSMGANTSEAMSDEKPVHRVTVSSFCMGQTEVTQALWKAVTGKNPSTYKGDNMPLHKASWDDCQKFITKLNLLTGFEFRMPTEAEWEFAARGGNLTHGYKFAGSNSIDDVAWYSTNSGNKIHDVATKAPNELGLYDMSGNVKEWCNDFYAAYSSAAQTNPTGPTQEEVTFNSRVNRGGAFNTVDALCRVSHRFDLQQTNGSYMLGMRLAIVIE